jgi:hypothetical protein
MLQRLCACGQHTGGSGECAECRKKRLGLQRQVVGETGPAAAPPIVSEVLRSPGRPLDAATRAFMEPRFGHDFSRVPAQRSSSIPMPARLAIGAPQDEYEREADSVAQGVMNRSAMLDDTRYDFSRVRIHTDARAAASAETVNARAYTVGHDIVFGAGEFAPSTYAGQGLLAHELIHVIQQNGSGGDRRRNVRVGRKISSPILQRSVHEGHDHGGRYEFDDQQCTFNYHQSWYFTFRTDQSPVERTNYMEAARRQIEDVWSRKFPLIPDQPGCFCHSGGVTVVITVHTHERERQGHGFTIIVTPTEERGWTTQPLRQIDLGIIHDQPVLTGEPGGQRVIAHEFGHTIGLTDEYHEWAALFNTEGSRDQPSIMHSGDEVRPRHYQHFADLINFEVGDRCTYRPAGRHFPEYENVLGRFSGFPFLTLPERAEFVIGLNYERRISNEALLGLIYPTTGVMSLWNPVDRSVQTGPTLGLRLNQIAHPLYVNVRTGILFDPENPRSVPDLRIPISAELGIRRGGFRVGASYTGISEILTTGNWTHLIGVDLQVDLP